MAERTTYVAVLDANVLIRDFWLQGDGFEYLDTHHFLGHRPAIPQVALDEVRSHLRKRAEHLLTNREGEQGSVGNTRRLLRLFHLSTVPDEDLWDVDDLLARWDAAIQRFLERHNGLVLPVPTIALTELAKRSVERQRPFSKGDKGFRDTLIWLSALELVAEDTRVSLITENTTDFFSGPGRPHPEIANEALQRTERYYWKILLHGSVDHFITHFDSDRGASADALVRALRSNQFTGLDLWQYLESHLPKLFSGGDILEEVRWAGFAQKVEAPFVGDVEELIALDIPYARHLEEEVYRVYCDLAFVGVFVGSIGYNAIDEIVHPNQRLWVDESDPYWTNTGVRAVGTLIAAVDIHVPERTVVGFSALPLQHWTSYASEVKVLDECSPDQFAELP